MTSTFLIGVNDQKVLADAVVEELKYFKGCQTTVYNTKKSSHAGSKGMVAKHLYFVQNGFHTLRIPKHALAALFLNLGDIMGSVLFGLHGLDTPDVNSKSPKATSW